MVVKCAEEGSTLDLSQKGQEAMLTLALLTLRNTTKTHFSQELSPEHPEGALPLWRP